MLVQETKSLRKLSVTPHTHTHIHTHTHTHTMRYNSSP